MQLTRHFNLCEFTISQFAERNGIENIPPPEAVENIKLLCRNVLEPLREVILRPIIISSGYRCKELNTAIGGTETSQHMEGKAADIIALGITPVELFRIIGLMVAYDQVIEEYGRWVHVSFNDNKNRKQKLIARRIEGKTVYNKFRESYG